MSKIKLLFIIAIAFIVTACDDAARVASSNISKAAANFEIGRRIVFYNGITGQYMLEIKGRCDMYLDDRTKIAVTCRDNDGLIKKHYLGLSDNVTYFAEQINPAAASTGFYRVTFNPTTILPDIRLAK